MDLKKDFNYVTINLKDDYEGKVFATLISSKLNKNNRSTILYIHGFIDYFFHPHVSDEFQKNGFDFDALELRKYGNSLQPHQHPNYCKSITEYFEEISIAIKTIYERSQNKVILLGHSTGGLIASLYLNTGKERELVSALVLNSPFLELNLPFLVRLAAPTCARVASFFAPFSHLKNAISPIYAKSLHKFFYGTWDFNLNWKPINGFPAYFAWFVAITKAQTQLKQHSNINVPILLLFSSKSIRLQKYNPEAQITDTVLNVKHIRELGTKLGTSVTIAVIENGMHDLFLSKKEVRDAAFKNVFDWLLKKEKLIKL